MAETFPDFQSDSPPTAHLPRRAGAVIRKVGQLVQGVENVVGALFAITVSLLVPTICLLGVFEPGHGRGGNDGFSLLSDRGLAIVGLVLSFSIEGYGLYLIFSALRQKWGESIPPIGPSAAMRHAQFPLLLRPVLAAWWLAHFLVAAGFGYGIELAGNVAARGRPTGDRVLLHLVTTTVAFGWVYAANTYLVLTFASIRRSERVIEAVWRRRILIDLLVVIAGTAAARLISK